MDRGDLNNNNDTNVNGNYRRQEILNHILLVEAAHQQSQSEAYEELKRLIIFAGIFFLFMIIFVLLKFQVSLDDVFKWSPVVWLVGVIVCGLLMNIFLQLKKFIKRRRAKRLREQQNLLYSLNLPTSFPCLAPPPHNETCCQCADLVPNVRSGNRRLLSSSMSSLNALNANILPSYDQVMRGAKTWMLSKAVFPPATTGNHRRQPLPPTYSAINIVADSCLRSCPAHSVIDEDNPCSSNSGNITNIPPPAYHEADLCCPGCADCWISATTDGTGERAQPRQTDSTTQQNPSLPPPFTTNPPEICDGANIQATSSSVLT